MDKLEKIIFTLNLIEVHGEANMSRLLGCIQMLQQIQVEQNAQKGSDVDE